MESLCLEEVPGNNSWFTLENEIEEIREGILDEIERANKKSGKVCAGFSEKMISIVKEIKFCFYLRFERNLSNRGSQLFLKIRLRKLI